MTISIRSARPADAARLREIEQLAGERFRGVGLGWVADDEPFSTETLGAYADAARAWVAADHTGVLVGYVLVDVVDDCAHVEQVSVHPDHQGSGIGRALLDQVALWAASTGRQSLTLTTFADVPWNRPLCEHLGFRVLAEAQIGPELRALRDVEAAHGLDRERRVCMRLELDG